MSKLSSENPRMVKKLRQKSVMRSTPSKATIKHSTSSTQSPIYRDFRPRFLKETISKVNCRIKKATSSIFQPSSIGEALFRNLEQEWSKEAVSPAKLEACSNALDRLIASDPQNAGLLSIIKQNYDLYIQSQHKELAESCQRTSELEGLLKEERALNKQLNKRFKGLAIENIELRNSLQEINQKLTPRCDSSTNQETEDHFHKVKEKLQRKLSRTVDKYQKVKLSNFKLNKALQLMRNRGVPVDAYLKEIVPQNNEKLWLEIPSFQETSSIQLPPSAEEHKPIFNLSPIEH